MTPKQQMFVLEYLKDLNATQAAIRSGYSEKTAKEQAARLLSKVHIAQAIEKALIKRTERTKIDTDWVLRKAVELYNKTFDEGQYGVAKGALELIGKHVDVDAFAASKHDVKGHITYQELPTLPDNTIITIEGEVNDEFGTSERNLPSPVH